MDQIEKLIHELNKQRNFSDQLWQRVQYLYKENKELKERWERRKDEIKETAERTDAHPQSPWIRTKKKLPKAINIEEFDDCGNIQWCTCHTKKCYVSYFVGFYAVSIDGIHKVWCDITGQEVCSPYDVDYYMPLPAIPEKGGTK